MVDLGADFSEEGVGGEDALIGTDLLLDGVIFISGVLYFLLLLLLQLCQSMLQQGILLLMLLRLLSYFIQFRLLLLQQILGPLFGYLQLLDIPTMLKINLL